MYRHVQAMTLASQLPPGEAQRLDSILGWWFTLHDFYLSSIFFQISFKTWHPVISSGVSRGLGTFGSLASFCSCHVTWRHFSGISWYRGGDWVK